MLSAVFAPEGDVVAGEPPPATAGCASIGVSENWTFGAIVVGTGAESTLPLALTRGSSVSV